MEALDARGELSADDLALLRRFEPILCFNVGEQFFPMDADRFLAGSRLCAQQPGKEPEELVPRGQLDASSLAQSPQADTPGVITFLSFASPLTATQVRAFHKSSTLNAGARRALQLLWPGRAGARLHCAAVLVLLRLQ